MCQCNNIFSQNSFYYIAHTRYYYPINSVRKRSFFLLLLSFPLAPGKREKREERINSNGDKGKINVDIYVVIWTFSSRFPASMYISCIVQSYNSTGKFKG